MSRLPKITVEERTNNAALNLSQAIRKKSTFFLPDTMLKDNMHKLASIFQQELDKIEQDKLTSINLIPYLQGWKKQKILPTSLRVNAKCTLSLIPPTTSSYLASIHKEFSLISES